MADRGDRCTKCDSVLRFVLRISNTTVDMFGCVYCIKFKLGPFEINEAGKIRLIEVWATKHTIRRNWSSVPSATIEMPDDMENIELMKVDAGKLSKWLKQAASNSNQMDWV